MQEQEREAAKLSAEQKGSGGRAAAPACCNLLFQNGFRRLEETQIHVAVHE